MRFLRFSSVCTKKNCYLCIVKHVLCLLLMAWSLMLGCTSDSHKTEVYVAVTGPHGKQWAGTKNGLYRQSASDDTFRQMPLPSLTHHPFPAIYALCYDSLNSRLWIGAWNHLYCYDLEKDKFITTTDSTIYETVGLMCDSLGRIRAFTGHGQYRFTLNDSLQGNELTEQLDSVNYHKPQYANIDTTGWTFEQKNGNGGLLPWLIALMLAAGIVALLFIKRRGRSLTPGSLTPDPSLKERGVYSSSTESSMAQTNHSPLLERWAGGEASFLERARKVVDAHLADKDFSIDQMASELAVSRAQLFRKLKAANGQTPKEFMDERRMARAAELLKTTDMTVAVIAGMVGYSDASNFRRAFVRTFGITPSEFTKKMP